MSLLFFMLSLLEALFSLLSALLQHMNQFFYARLYTQFMGRVLDKGWEMGLFDLID